MRRVPVLITTVHQRAKNPYRVPRYAISLVKDGGSVYVKSDAIANPLQVYKVTKDLFEGADREQFYVLCLDAKKKIIGINLVSVGTLSSALVHPREVFKAAILLNAHSIIFVHNHPSGDHTPSRADTDLTRRLVEVGVLMGIDVVDHIICGESTYYSMEDHDLISEYKKSARIDFSD